MRRNIKVASILLLVTIVLGFLVKHENFLQTHYDTLEERNLERSSLFGIDIMESVKWSKGGYQKEYREIFDADYSDERWRAWPIRTIWLGTDHWRSPRKYPDSLLLRNSITRRIFERYERNHSIPLARDAFRELEALLPVSKEIEGLDYHEFQSLRTRIKTNTTLQDLIPLAPR